MLALGRDAPNDSVYVETGRFHFAATRNQLGNHADAVKQVVVRKMLVMGLQHFSADDLRAVKQARQKLDIRVLGLASIAHDVTPELALATITSLEVLGALQASKAVKAALADRLR